MGAVESPYALSDTWLFNTTSEQWVLVNSTGPSARWGATAVAYEDAVYVFGGFTSFDVITFEWAPCNELWTFDLTTLTWSSSPEPVTGQLPPARGLPSSIVVGSTMYVVAGCSQSLTLDQRTNRCEQPFSDLYQLDIGSLEWSSVPVTGSLPTGAVALSNVHNGSLIAFYQVDYVAATSIFDIETSIWSSVDLIPQSPNPEGRFGASFTNAGDGYYFLYGGMLIQYMHACTKYELNPLINRRHCVPDIFPTFVEAFYLQQHLG